MTLAAWFVRALGVRVLAAVLALAAVLQLADLFEAAPRLFDEGRGAGGVGLYTLLHLPDVLLQAAPLGVLAGALFGWTRLARDGAVTTLRAAGVSAYRLVGLAAPAGAAAALALLVLGGWLAPAGEAALATWLAKGEPTPAAPADTTARRSFRLGPDIISAAQGDADGASLRRVEVDARDRDGRLLRRLTAEAAVRGADGRWRLHDATWETYDRAGVAAGRAAELAWSDRIDPADVRALWRADAAPSPAAARRALRGGVAPLPLSSYRVQLARIWAAPAGALAMLLIAAPAALGHARDGSVGRLSLACLAAGLGFLVADGVLGALGAAGAVPAAAAVWAAPVLFAVGAAAALLHLEG